MPSSKTTRNTRQIKDTVPASETAQQLEAKSPARKTRSVKANETSETNSGKAHRKATEADQVTAVAATPKVKAAAAGVGQTHTVTLMADPIGDVLMPEITSARIAELAYSYYVSRGHEHGDADEDWLRAERELAERN